MHCTHPVESGGVASRPRDVGDDILIRLGVAVASHDGAGGADVRTAAAPPQLHHHQPIVVVAATTLLLLVGSGGSAAAVVVAASPVHHDAAAAILVAVGSEGEAGAAGLVPRVGSQQGSWVARIS